MAKFSMTAPGSFSETATKSLMDQYRGIVATRYQPCSHTQILTTIKSSAFVVSRKYDGELWYLVTAGSDSKLVAANGRVVTGAHPILDGASKLASGLLLAGELYVPADKGRERVGDVSQALANGGAGLSFAAFDLVSGPDGTFQDQPYQTRLEAIEAAISSSPELHVVGTKRMADPQDLVSYFDTEILANGFEGVVVRSDDGRAFKVKQERTVDAVVIGFTERESATGGIETRSLLLGLKNEDEFILVGVAANAVSDFSRTDAHQLLKSQVVESEYRHAASTGQVYQMVRPDVIVEVNVVDIQSTDSKGLPMKQPTLDLSQITSGLLANKSMQSL
jgi:ATP-dependent DNA ligase